MKRTLLNKFFYLFVLLIGLLGAKSVTAQVTNGGFEDSSSLLTSWSGSGTVSTGVTILNWTVKPADSRMASIVPGGYANYTAAQTALNLSSGLAYSSCTNFGLIYQDVTLTANQTLTIWWNYVSEDYSPYDDGAFASFVGPGVSTVTTLVRTVTAGLVSATGSYGSSGWHTVSFTAPQNGTYRLGFGVFNWGDTAVQPHLFVDNAAGGTMAPGDPILTTNAVTNVSGISSTTGGNVTSYGSGATSITARGVVYNTSGTPAIGSGTQVSGGTGLGSFSVNLTGLTKGTTYYARAYATNNLGKTAYGGTVNFTTLSSVAPTVTTTNISNITATTASSGGNVTDDGGETVTAKGICWNTGGSPIVSDNHTSDGSGTGSYSNSLTSLSANTTYYVRAYATSSAGTGYGSQVSFKTAPLAPVAQASSSIGAYSFIANWSASTGATTYYLDVSTDSNFSTYLSGYQNKNVGNVTTYPLSGLISGQTYYYRLRADNGSAISTNSNTINLTTKVLNNFLIEAYSGGNIVTQTAGVAFTVKITARDASNATIIDYVSSAAITSNSTLTNGATTANFVNGVLQSHQVILTQAGTLKTLTATQGGVSSTSNTFTVLPASINSFTLVANGGNPVTAGTPFSVQVTVYDQYSNIKTNYEGDHEVMWNTTALSSPSGLTRVIPNNGVQPFTAGVATVSGFTFYNSDQTQLTPFTSPTITITDGPTSKVGTETVTVHNALLDNFKVEAGLVQTSGTPFAVKVTARDTYWNTCVDYSGNILFNSSADYDPTGTISYSKNGQSFASYNGVRTFSNFVTINPVGVYWLSVTDKLDPGKSGQQQNIVVGPGAFTRFAVTQSASVASTLTVDKSTCVAGDQVVVTLTPRDAQGNLLYSCRDISVYLNGSTTQLTGPNTTSTIVVNNVGDGTYTANVRVTQSGTNTITATFNETGVSFDEYRVVTVTPAATHHYVLNSPTDIVAGGTRAAYTVTRYDIYNNLKTAGAETVYLNSTSDGVNKGFYLASTLGTAVSSITIPDGYASANFWYYDEKAGNWTISASDASPENGATGIIDATDYITVSQASPHHLALNSPADITAGSVTRAAYTVTLQDIYNNTAVVSGATTTVTLTSSSAGVNKKFYSAASAGNVINQVSLAAGVSSANFWYYDQKAGTHTITVSASGINNGEDIITVLPNLLKNFVVSGVADPHDLGTMQSVTVEALDTYDNRKTDYEGTIMFGSDIQAKLPSPYTFALEDQGIHTFSNAVKFSQPGECYVKVWDKAEAGKWGFQYNITVQRAVTVTANARNKTYGDVLTLGTTEFTVTGTNYIDVNGNSVSPVVSGDIIGVVLSASGTAATDNAGTYTITASGATFTSVVSSDSYHITYGQGLLTVNPRNLAVTATGVDKVYDGTVSATVSLSDDRITGDVLTSTYTAATFDNKNAGTGKTVSVTAISISGTDAANYAANTTTTTTATITQRDLAVTATGVDRVYDGTVSATVSLSDDRITGDVLTSTYTAATFDNKNAGTGKTV
ncbi:MAG: YDG domain-containing protein, partial [Prolixibacteraceae bacterium]|nr:YDG domain-containing protein [Prolixibacteraceae bacterium]